MEIVQASGLGGARSARGTVVIIDVLRAFTVSAYALAEGAVCCRLTGTVEEARALARRVPNSVISAEEEGLPVPGIPLSNSPTLVRQAGLRGRTLIQRSTSGVQCVLGVQGAEALLATGLVTAAATARWILSRRPEVVALVASGEDRGHPEDRACALQLEALLRGKSIDLRQLLAPLRESQRYAQVTAGRWPGFPASDLELALTDEQFDFAMPLARDELGLVVRADPIEAAPSRQARA